MHTQFSQPIPKHAKFQVPVKYFLCTHLYTQSRAINDPLTVHSWSILNSLILSQVQCSFWWFQISWRLVWTRATKAVHTHDAKPHFFLDSALHRLLTSSTSDSRRWPENPHLLCQHQAVTRPMPWPPRAPQSSCPPAGTAGANYFLLLAAGCGFAPLFCEEGWGCSKAEKSQALTSELWQAWVWDHWKRPKATCGCHHRQTAAVKWRIPMWTSWRRYRSDINRNDIACKWELHFPHFSTR